jgi:hypothetical protein
MKRIAECAAIVETAAALRREKLRAAKLELENDALQVRLERERVRGLREDEESALRRDIERTMFEYIQLTLVERPASIARFGVALKALRAAGGMVYFDRYELDRFGKGPEPPSVS